MNKKIVIKIGSDVLTSRNGLNENRIKDLANQITEIQKTGYEIVIVSSGAVSSGIRKLGLENRSWTLAEKRFLSAIGQNYLMSAWTRAFSSSCLAQVLLTWRELDDEESALKCKETIYNLLSLKTIPIINENDAIADEELSFGDNDQLAFKLAKLIHAQRLIILTDVDGLFTENPKKNESAKKMKKVRKVNEEILAMIDDSGSSFGTGGMLSKVLVAKKALESNITVNIINGKKDKALERLLKNGENLGTEFSK